MKPKKSQLSTLQSGAYSKELGGKIKDARESQRISQKELAKLLKISDKAISSYEVGRTSPSIETLEKLSTIVQKPLSYFSQKTTSDTIQEKLARIEKELQEVKDLLKTQKS